MEDLDTASTEMGEQACGRTICVLAEAWAWPTTSYSHKFRDEFKSSTSPRVAVPKQGQLCAPDAAFGPRRKA